MPNPVPKIRHVPNPARSARARRDPESLHAVLQRRALHPQPRHDEELPSSKELGEDPEIPRPRLTEAAIGSCPVGILAKRRSGQRRRGATPAVGRRPHARTRPVPYARWFLDADQAPRAEAQGTYAPSSVPSRRSWSAGAASRNVEAGQCRELAASLSGMAGRRFNVRFAGSTVIPTDSSAVTPSSG